MYFPTGGGMVLSSTVVRRLLESMMFVWSYNVAAVRKLVFSKIAKNKLC